MSLLTTAAADLQAILTDTVGGFAVPITVTDPNGTTAVINGVPNDVGTSIDPQTGTLVAGRRSSVALSIAALAVAGLGEPKSIADTALKPWLVSFTLPTGGLQNFKVATALPDEGLGCIVCLLEAYTP